MFETYTTVTGNLITAVSMARLADGTSRASFRVASNERRRDRNTGEWGKGDTFYVSVTCWRWLADNVAASFVSGDPIVVHGRLSTREYDKDGVRHWATELDAIAVGPDLNRSTAVVTRTKRAGSGAVPGGAESAGTGDRVASVPAGAGPVRGAAVGVEAGVGA